MTAIERIRKEKGISRAVLAKNVGVTPEAIGNYENGNREPKASILKKIAEVLECSMEDLI